jgi:hypothetical protein
MVDSVARKSDLADRIFNATSGMHGASVETGSLSKVYEIHIQNASIVASPQQLAAALGVGAARNCKTPGSKMTINDGHFPLSSICDITIDTRPR